MKYLFFGIILCGCGGGLYYSGYVTGMAACRVRVAADSAVATHNMIKKLNDIDGGVYDETVRRGADDIRRVLRARYTIAE